MKSVDTNIVVRIITKDDPLQTPLALAAFNQPVFLAASVFLETEWVLRAQYRWTRERINEALRELLLLEGVNVHDLDGLLWCLERHRAGADLADMIHSAGSKRATSFLTFERKMDVAAGPSPPVPVERLL